MAATLLPPDTKVGEAAANVQAATYGERLKAVAAVYTRLLNSPATRKDFFILPMKTIIHTALLLSVGFSLVSCVGQTQLATPSGRPEVTVRPPVSKAQSAAIERMTTAGFALTNQTANSLTFERDMPPAQAAIFQMGVGNAYHSQPKAVIRFTFVSAASGKVRIFGTVHAFTQGPFGQVKTLDITNGKAAQELQGTLERIQQDIGQ